MNTWIHQWLNIKRMHPAYLLESDGFSWRTRQRDVIIAPCGHWGFPVQHYHHVILNIYGLWHTQKLMTSVKSTNSRHTGKHVYTFTLGFALGVHVGGVLIGCLLMDWISFCSWSFLFLTMVMVLATCPAFFSMLLLEYKHFTS